MLATLIFRAKSNGKFRGVVTHLVEDDLSILQYVDDTILFMDHDMLQAKDLKVVHSSFQQLSGLKINFHKSELFLLWYGAAKDCEQEYARLFGCKLGGFPFRYLGIPMNHKKLSNKDWAFVEKFPKNLGSTSKSYIIMHMDTLSLRDDLLFDYDYGLLVYVTIIVDEHVVILYLHHSFSWIKGLTGCLEFSKLFLFFTKTILSIDSSFHNHTNCLNRLISAPTYSLVEL
jgi:hypothetical protein